MSLKNKTINGIIWTVTQQFSVQIINFSVQIILARLLLPEAFGLIAIIQVFASIGQTLMDGGMTSSLIRTKDLDQKDYSTVFFMNITSSIFIYTVLYFCAPFIAVFFEKDELTLLIRVFTLSFIIQALVGVQTTKLTKEMNFKLQMYMQIPATILGGIVGVLLAINGYGVWSIIWMSLTTTFFFMLQHWFRSSWKPSLVIDKNRLLYHFKFGYKLTLSSLLTNLYHNSYTIIIGKFFSTTQLGFYNQANSFRMFPVSNITTALQKVTYPVFSSLQDDNVKLRNAFSRITEVIFFIVCPIMLSLIVVAEPLFRFVLTDKWDPAVPFFQILCFSAIFYPLSMYNLNIILAKGRSDIHFKLELLKKGASITFLLLIIPFGIWGVILAQAISMLIHAGVNSYFSGKMMGYSIKEQITDITPTLILGFIVMFMTYLIELTFINDLNDFLRISIGLISYFTIYLTLSYFLKMNSILELRLIIKQGYSKYKKNNSSI